MLHIFEFFAHDSYRNAVHAAAEYTRQGRVGEEGSPVPAKRQTV